MIGRHETCQNEGAPARVAATRRRRAIAPRGRPASGERSRPPGRACRGAQQVVTAEWVRMKCLFGGCQQGRCLTCPPHSPRPRRARRVREPTPGVLDEYSNIVLLRFDVQPERAEWLRASRRVADVALRPERELFLAGAPQGVRDRRRARCRRVATSRAAALRSPHGHAGQPQAALDGGAALGPASRSWSSTEAISAGRVLSDTVGPEECDSRAALRRPAPPVCGMPHVFSPRAAAPAGRWSGGGPASRIIATRSSW